MGGGEMTKEVKEMFLEQDIEEHRQTTLGVFSTEEYKKARKEFEEDLKEQKSSKDERSDE